MVRALQTGAIIHASLPNVPEERTDMLRECAPPAQDQRDLAQACGKQLNQAFASWFHPALASETDILVCHGNAIRYLVMKALGADPRLCTHLSIGHTSLTEVQVRADGSVRVLMVGDIGHLPPNLQSGTGDRTPELAVSGNPPKVGCAPHAFQRQILPGDAEC